MSELILLYNPHCSKSRTVLELLEARDLQPQVVCYLGTPPSVVELKAILVKFGILVRQLLRAREDEYKALGLDEPSLGEEAIIEAMAKHPKLIERPMLVANDRAVVSWPPEKVLKIPA